MAKDRIRIDPSVVRGLEYYTGPVFEAELTFQVKNEDGQPVRFGSVGGGGRYDGLVERFTGAEGAGHRLLHRRLAPAGGAGGAQQGQAGRQRTAPSSCSSWRRTASPTTRSWCRRCAQAGIRAEMYLGTSGMKAQMKYADKRGAPCVVIQGGDERAKGEVQIKDLVEGAKAAATIKDNKEWREGRPAQVSVTEADLVAKSAKSSRGTRASDAHAIPAPTRSPSPGALRQRGERAGVRGSRASSDSDGRVGMPLTRTLARREQLSA